MIPLQITTDCEQHPWTDLAGALPGGMGKITRIGRLPCGMSSGKSSIAVLVEMPDGTQCVAETSMALFLAAARALRAIEDEMSGANAKN